MKGDFELERTKAERDRVKTGIEGLDSLIQGGIPKGAFVLITGIPGSGKTIMGLQYLAYNVLVAGKKGLLISVEQSENDLLDQARQFGWDFETAKQLGNLKIIAINSVELFDLQKIYDMKKLFQEEQYDVAVFDSISSMIGTTIFPLHLELVERGVQSTAFREVIHSNVSALIEISKQFGVTTLGIAQKVEGMPGDTTDGISEFKADGLILLGMIEVGEELKRTIKVKKLRKTKIDGLTYTFEFTDNGIVVKAKEV